MFSGIQAWIDVNRATQKRDMAILSLVVTVFALLACDLGGGSSATPGCNKANSGCYAIVGYSSLKTDFTAYPHGVYTAVDLDQLGCDSNCISESGYIANYLLLGGAGLAGPWISVGYRATGLQAGATVYYSAEYDGTNLTFHDFAPVSVADDGYEGQFAINRLTAAPYFYIRYAAPSGWNKFDYGLKSSLFTPASAEFGEILHGTKGESANIEWFDGGSYTPNDQPAIVNLAPALSEFPNELLGEGFPKMDNPPYGKWITINGAPVWFETACCSSPL